MSSKNSMTNSAYLELEAGTAGISRNSSPGRTLKLSSAALLRHLADVAELSEAEGDFRIAEHLVDVVYHLASCH